MSRATLSAASPSIAVAFQSSEPESVRDATHLGIGLSRSAHGPVSAVQYPARPSYVGRPISIPATSRNRSRAAWSCSPSLTNHSLTSDTPSAVVEAMLISLLIRPPFRA